MSLPRDNKPRMKSGRPPSCSGKIKQLMVYMITQLDLYRIVVVALESVEDRPLGDDGRDSALEDSPSRSPT